MWPNKIKNNQQKFLAANQHDVDPAILCSPVHVLASFNILKLCTRVPSPLASFHHKPTNLLRYGRLFMLFMVSLPVARPAQLSRFEAPDFQADNLAIPDLKANPLPVTLPVPLVSQCCHPNSPYDSTRLLKAQTWQPPPFPPLERTIYSFEGVHRPFPGMRQSDNCL